MFKPGDKVQLLMPCTNEMSRFLQAVQLPVNTIFTIVSVHDTYVLTGEDNLELRLFKDEIIYAEKLMPSEILYQKDSKALANSLGMSVRALTVMLMRQAIQKAKEHKLI